MKALFPPERKGQDDDDDDDEGMENSANLGPCYPPRPSASVDETLLDLQTSSYSPTQRHSIIGNCQACVMNVSK